jgi:hypothetical protein
VALVVAACLCILPAPFSYRVASCLLGYAAVVQQGVMGDGVNVKQYT